MIEWIKVIKMSLFALWIFTMFLPVIIREEFKRIYQKWRADHVES